MADDARSRKRRRLSYRIQSVAKPEDAQQNSTLDQDGSQKSPLVGMEEVAYAVPGLAQNITRSLPRTARTGHRPHETLSHE